MPARHRHPIYSARSRELAGGLLGVVAPATIIGGVHASVLLASSEWLAILALAITGVAVAFVVYNLSHFRRGRLAKAILLDPGGTPLKELVFDPQCPVSVNEAQAKLPGRGVSGEEEVESSGYRIKAVHAENLHLILVFRGRSAPDHADYATFLMLGVEERFNEARQAQFETLQRSLDSRAAAADERDAKAGERDRTIDSREAGVTPRERELAEREAAIAARERVVQEHSSRTDGRARELEDKAKGLHSGEAALTQRERDLENARGSLGPERKAFDERVARFDEESRRRRDALDAEARSLAEERETFEASREERAQWIASKEIEIESREQSLGGKEEAVRAQAGENAERLADLARREEAVEVAADQQEKTRAELETKRLEVDRQSHALEAKSA